MKAVAITRRHAKGNIIDQSNSNAIGLPPQFIPSLPSVAGSEGVIKSYILPDNQTGVVRCQILFNLQQCLEVLTNQKMFVGSFEGDFDGFQADVVSIITTFKNAGVTQLLIDLTNNGGRLHPSSLLHRFPRRSSGGFVCLGQFLHQYLSGSTFGYPYVCTPIAFLTVLNTSFSGFVSTVRANTLAQKIVATDIELELTDTLSFYTGDNYAFLNGTHMGANFNYITPSVPFIVNGRSDPTSQRFHVNAIYN
ncbi:hypothetical protein C0989_008086 [Termitomyces sp. Mn162]|nr:hypothetical protein C0989_008086 [Termitomyces sp. Mn162]